MSIFRNLAYDWHGGQWSPLYALASSGLVEDMDALLEEIGDCLEQSSVDGDTPAYRQLCQLKDWVVELPFNGAVWYAPWARMIPEVEL